MSWLLSGQPARRWRMVTNCARVRGPLRLEQVLGHTIHQPFVQGFVNGFVVPLGLQVPEAKGRGSHGRPSRSPDRRTEHR